MTSNEAVLRAGERLLKVHRDELLLAKQVSMSFVPNFGHGDDLWLRTETLHAIGEITTSGAGKAWGDIRGTKRREIQRKIRILDEREGVTHRYLFVVGKELACSLQGVAGPRIIVEPLSDA